jgi:hypothetical protein
MLGCTVGNSKSQLHKARLRLRNLLQSAPPGARKRREEFIKLVNNCRISSFPSVHVSPIAT